MSSTVAHLLDEKRRTTTRLLSPVNQHPSIVPYGLYHCRDGAVQIAAGSESLWRDLCDGFNLDPDTPGMATNPQRVAHRAAVTTAVEAAFASWDAAPLLARLADLGVPSGKVRTLDEVYTWDQTRSQGLLIDVDHTTLGHLTLPGPPLRFFTDSTDGADGELVEVTRRAHEAPPTLDEDGDAIRSWIGLNPPEQPGN
jgi:crotonobetainyl-CoA:carnitine CoA-transferase CaiB-like acyl-CoA transferase